MTMRSVERHNPIVCVRSKPLADSTWIGSVTYIGSILVIQPELVSIVLLLAAFIIVPLGIRIVRRQADGTMSDRLLRTLSRWQLVAAMSLAAAVAVPVGWLSMILALPWMTVTWLIAVCGLMHFLRRPRKFADINQLGFDVGMIFLAIGGIWTVFHRLGHWPGDFPPVIAQLTAVHFHYAGFALPIIAGQVSALVNVRAVRLLVPAIAVSAMLLALGITYSPTLELWSALMLIVTAIFIGILQIRFALRQSRPDVFTLLSISGVALLSGMGLAAVYAVGEYLGALEHQAAYTGGEWIDVPLMIRLHGVTLAFGFVLTGMLGLAVRNGPARQGSVDSPL